VQVVPKLSKVETADQLGLNTSSARLRCLLGCDNLWNLQDFLKIFIDKRAENRYCEKL